MTLGREFSFDDNALMCSRNMAAIKDYKTLIDKVMICGACFSASYV